MQRKLDSTTSEDEALSSDKSILVRENTDQEEKGDRCENICDSPSTRDTINVMGEIASNSHTGILLLLLSA